MNIQRSASLVNESKRLRAESLSITHEITAIQQELRRTVKAIDKRLSDLRRSRKVKPGHSKFC